MQLGLNMYPGSNVAEKSWIVSFEHDKEVWMTAIIITALSLSPPTNSDYSILCNILCRAADKAQQGG